MNASKKSFATFALLLAGALAFADTVTFDKKNKGNKNDFVTVEFNSMEELQRACRKYKNKNAVVFLEVNSPLKNKLPEIYHYFPGNWNYFDDRYLPERVQFSDTNSNRVIVAFKFDGTNYGLASMKGIETVSEYEARVAHLKQLEQEEAERDENEKAGLGRITNAEKMHLENEKKIASAKNKMDSYIRTAKSFESKELWIFALGTYYEGLSQDVPLEAKTEIQNEYDTLANAIKSGEPGLGTYNVFTKHDGWEKLLVEAEQYGTKYGILAFDIGQLKSEDFDWKKRTVTYSIPISVSLSTRCKNTIEVIRQGADVAKMLPEPPYLYRYGYTTWPNTSFAGANGETFINGVGIYNSGEYSLATDLQRRYFTGKEYYRHYNAFSRFGIEIQKGMGAIFGLDTINNLSLYDLAFTLVDENGRQLIKPQRSLLKIYDCRWYEDFIEKGTFNAAASLRNIPQDIMDLIESGKARLKLAGIYLQYGSYIDQPYGDNERGFIKNFAETPLDMNGVEVSYPWK